MAKVVNVGYTDTPISGVSSLNFPRGLVNFGADFRIKNDTGSELLVTNITSPVDRPEALRWAYTDVQDIYKGTNVDPSVYAPSKRGLSLLAQVSETWSVTDSVDATFRVDLPVSAHIVLKIPASEFITAQMIQTLVGRLVSGIYDTGDLTTTRLNALMRGSLYPSDLK